MKIDVVDEKHLPLVQRGEQAGDFVGQRRQLFRRRALGSEARRAHLQQSPRLVDIVAGDFVQRGEKAQRVGSEGGRSLRNVGAGSTPRAHDAERGQRPKAGADCGPADADLSREVTLGRQTRARSQRAVIDQPPYVGDDLRRAVGGLLADHVHKVALPILEISPCYAIDLWDFADGLANVAEPIVGSRRNWTAHTGTRGDDTVSAVRVAAHSWRHSMQRTAIALAVIALIVTMAAQAFTPAGSAVTVTPDEAARRVDIAIGGAPFTSYIWPENVKKPVLDPIRSATGTIVTRGWPLNPRPGERVDHPHHVGLWFNYESVNGVDFWNTSDALKPDELAKMGTIVHRRIVTAKGGPARGELVTESDWMLPGNKELLHERTQFFFSGNGSARTIDRIATLTALDQPVVFADAKDGMLGMRVARQLEQPSNEPVGSTATSGRATTVPAMDNTGITGEYTSSEGKKGDAVWGTRGRWTRLSGKIGGEPVSIAIVDHPKNPGFPTYWHARGYGLFAANPLGQKVFTEGRETMNFTIAPHASATFAYRVIVLDGPVSADRLDREFAAFSGAQPAPSSRR